MGELNYGQTRTVNYSSSVPGTEERTTAISLRVLGSSRQVDLSSPKCSIGSARNNTLVLSDPFVSKHHCSLLWREGDLWVQDEGSRNGTWVNNIRVDSCEVLVGSRIMLGRTALQLMGPTQENRTYGIVGDHPSIKKILTQIERFGSGSRPVLVQGETGTGKELVARAIHDSSPCRFGPFEPLNCGAIPRELAETELFGHAQGAFTGASKERKGAFERADGGTLFLDEIGEMPLELQPKLLRVLEENAVQRIGDDQRRSIAVRIVAATHRDLLKEAERGRFRLDLYHRLAVCVIQLPPLRQRSEDIPLLVQHFLEQSGGAVPLQLDERVISFLQQQLWRGNVRELRNALHRAAAEAGQKITIGDFNFLNEQQKAMENSLAGYIKYLGRSFQDIRQDIYQQVLRIHGGNRSAAAMALGIPKSTFFDQLREMEVVESITRGNGDLCLG